MDAGAPIPLFIRSAADGVVECSLCPYRCAISPGRSGICRVRANAGGRPALPYFGRISAMNTDPIEKKPLYHFRPGSRVFSVGFLGCNLRCPFCQNWSISQSADAPTREIDPRSLIGLARDSACGAIAYTYSEPLVHIEYVMEAMAIAREEGLANILVTNGCVTPDAARAVLADCDAVNVDLKSFDASTYDRTLGGELGAVRDFIETAFRLGVHTEATTLVVTGMNDRVEEIESCAGFLAALSPDIPYHLSAYRPEHRYAEPPTDPALLQRCARAAGGKLRYVYVGNAGSTSWSDTPCPACGKATVVRRGYSIDLSGLDRVGGGNSSRGYRCRACGSSLPFRN